MVRFLLQRPIAVFLTFFSTVVLGLFLFNKIPISLLPAIEVPQIIVRVNYPNTAAKVLEENIVKNIRENLLTLDNLENIESESKSHTASIRLTFDYGTSMDLAYIAVNEKLDRITNNLPKDFPRPQVIRINTSDIPVARIQIIPKDQRKYVEVSELTKKILRKRIEQIEGVSIVDVNGERSEIITIEPNKEILSAIGLSEGDLEQAIRSANTDIGSLSVKDGQYRYFVKLVNRFDNLEEISNTPLTLSNGTVTNVGKISTIRTETSEPQGYHLYNGKEGLVVTVQKQEKSKMTNLADRISIAVDNFKIDYPDIDFAVTQDQTYLLDQGIQNLSQDLWFGGAFCVILLFLFVGNYASPLLMSLSIPISLFLTFIFFYFFNISFNIISLSGLALGIGMLIDNSIVVLDSITRKRREGLSIDDSCIIGVKEVLSPVISNVLTTVAIYAPLIYMSGFAGALIYDQAIALTISLAVSLVVAFCLNPVMYKYFLKLSPEKLQRDTKLYSAILSGYHKMINHIFKRKRYYFLITILIMPLGFILFKFVPVTTLPSITETETLLKIDWNSPIDAKENLKRVNSLTVLLMGEVLISEAEIGLKQFVLQEDNGDLQKAEIYYKCFSETQKTKVDEIINTWFIKNYPRSNWEIQSAPNAFTQLFESKRPYLEARFKPASPMSEAKENASLNNIVSKIDVNYLVGKSFNEDVHIEMILDHEKMATYGVTSSSMQQGLNRLFGSENISEIRRFGDRSAIRFKNDRAELKTKLNGKVKANNGISYSLNSFLSYSDASDRKYILADKSGVYQSISFLENEAGDVGVLQESLSKLASDNGFYASFTGSYFDNQRLVKDLTVIFFISLILLYFILAIQFENFVHPFLVMLTIPLGIGGSMLVLWLAGGTLNIMAAIGFVVVLGIIVDDPSLKVETINRLRKEYLEAGMTNKKEILLKALNNAGEICLKPLLMVSLTTSLALLPVLFWGGIGNDLQKPLVFVIIGGLTIGTFFTLWFIPLAYWFITKKGK